MQLGYTFKRRCGHSPSLCWLRFQDWDDLPIFNRHWRQILLEAEKFG